MKRRLLFLAAALASASCGGSDGAAGAPGPQGEPGTPPAAGTVTPPAVTLSINQVVPRVGLIGKGLEVALSFDGGPAPEGATVSFGDGVKVTKVSPAGGSLRCTIEIDPGTQLGARDVTVTGGGAPIVAKQGFVVAAPLDVKVSGGKAEQGGLVRVDVSNHDQILFDAENFQLLPLVASANDASLIPIANSGFTATDGTVVMLGDPLAKTGPLGLIGVNDLSDPSSTTFLSAPDALTVAARTPITLTGGAPAEKTLANELETAFYSASFAPETDKALLVDAIVTTPDGSTMTPRIVAWPESGRIGELLDDKTEDPGFPGFIPPTESRVAYPVTKATKGFFVVFDAGFAHGPTTKFSLDVKTYTVASTRILEETASDHATGDTAQNLVSLPGADKPEPGIIVTGELKAAGESDVYKLSGLSASKVTDIQLSVLSGASIAVLVDKVPTLDGDDLVEVDLGGQAGNGTTSGFVGQERYIQVLAVDGKSTGTYTLGIRRLP